MASTLDCSVAMAWGFADEATEETARLIDTLADDWTGARPACALYAALQSKGTTESSKFPTDRHNI